MNSVEAHYSEPDLGERWKDALRRSGLNPERMDQADLAGRDQFHVGGLPATDELAQLAQIKTSDRVLDIGSGIGGPSRHLAASIGCHITGIDLTEEYCEVATMMAQSTGLSHLVHYQRGDALAMPFEDGSFDVVWTQHVAMNIEDRPGLYGEMFRVLKKGGRLALHDIVAGTGTVRYPVPWARQPELSFLLTEDQMREVLLTTGFREVAAQEGTAAGIAALRQMAAGAGSPGVGIPTLLGPEFPAMIANLTANIEDGACRLVQAVFAK